MTTTHSFSSAYRHEIRIFTAIMTGLFLGLGMISPVFSQTETSPHPVQNVVRHVLGANPKSEVAAIKSEIMGASSQLGGWIDRTADNIGSEALAGPGFLGINGARYLASFVFLILTGVLTAGVVRFIRTKAGRIQTGDIRKKSWPKVLLTAARKPLALVLWIYGFYFTLGILFDAMDPTVAIAFLGDQLNLASYVGLTIAIFWLAFRIITVAQKKMLAGADMTRGVLRRVLVPVVGLALRASVVILGMLLLRESLDLSPASGTVASKLIAVVAIASIAHLIIRATATSEKVLLTANRMDVADNLRARQIHTQVSVIRKIIVLGVSVLAVACILMLFQPVRQFGTSILASAGIAGIVLGLAAQKTLSNLFAGIQIAISQPIRIDDVVIVEGEWGWIEEISLTFVTVRVWDLRRLVLPITYFIEKPFQNWTRTSAKLINSVFLHADYTLPVEPLREELTRLLKSNPHWDGDVSCLQVTDSTARSMEIRCLMSSVDAPKGWNLKCEIREGLVRFLQENFPDSLPRVRAELQGEVRP